MRDLYHNTDLHIALPITELTGLDSHIGSVQDLQAGTGALYTILAGRVQDAGVIRPRLVHANERVLVGGGILVGDDVGPEELHGSIEAATYLNGEHGKAVDIGYAGARRFVQLILEAEGVPVADTHTFGAACHIHRLRTVPSRMPG